MHLYYFEVWHLKYLYVIILFAGREKYPRGRRGGFAKALGRATGAGVRIPPSPPKQIKKSRKDVFRDFSFSQNQTYFKKYDKTCS